VTITPQPGAPSGLTAAVWLVLQDGTGARQITSLGTVAADARPQVLRADLVRRGAAVTPPLSVVAVQTEWILPDTRGKDPSQLDPGASADVDLVVDQVAFADVAQAGAAAGGSGPRGRPLLTGRAVDWHVTGTGGTQGATATGSGATLLTGRITVPVGLTEFLTSTSTVFTTWTPDAGQVVGVAGAGLLEAIDIPFGDPVGVRVGDIGTTVNVRTVVPYLPGLDPARPQLLVDYDAITRHLIEAGGTVVPITEWWAGVSADRSAAWAEAVTARGLGTATSRVGLGEQLQRQPLRVGIAGALWLVVLAAAAFAGTGFAMHTTVAVRLRRVEFSQLRALGITRRALTGVVWAESGLLGLLGVGCGIGLGALLSLLVAPMVSLTADGSRPLPPVLVHIPWADVGLLSVGVCGVLAVVLLVVTRALRRSALGAVLRLGDER
jgi:hypothetical protein